VLQENRLFNRSVRENIALREPGMPMASIVAAAQLAGAHEFILGLPEGYDTVVGEQGVGLSGGQRQRIALARALVTDPRLLILDEATSSLDGETEAAITDAIQDLKGNVTVILIAHRLSSIRNSDKIIYLENGQITAAGTFDQVRIEVKDFALQAERMGIKD
jgi:subfamily B ATP-binding cassette protein HlyB/CyaB